MDADKVNLVIMQISDICGRCHRGYSQNLSGER